MNNQAIPTNPFCKTDFDPLVTNWLGTDKDDIKDLFKDHTSNEYLHSFKLEWPDLVALFNLNPAELRIHLACVTISNKKVFRPIIEAVVSPGEPGGPENRFFLTEVHNNSYIEGLYNLRRQAQIRDVDVIPEEAALTFFGGMKYYLSETGEASFWKAFYNRKIEETSEPLREPVSTLTPRLESCLVKNDDPNNSDPDIGKDFDKLRDILAPEGSILTIYLGYTAPTVISQYDFKFVIEGGLPNNEAERMFIEFCSPCPFNCPTPPPTQ